MLFGNRRLNVLVIGTDGMFGHDLYAYLLDYSRSKTSPLGVVHGIDDNGIIKNKLRFKYGLGSFLDWTIHYDYVINCIAYTDTKRAEDGMKSLSYELNALVPMYFANACANHGTKFIHISTDYVFSEWVDPTLEHMFTPEDTPAPKNTYGLHKLIGERLVLDAFGKNQKNVTILRTSWLYGNHGHKSFVHRFLRNVYDSVNHRFREGSFVMTDNEFSIPTSTADLAKCVLNVMLWRKHGILHAVNRLFTNTCVSRLDFANAILREMGSLYGNQTECVTLRPAETHDIYPFNSTLETSFNFLFDCETSWRDSLDKFIEDNFSDIMQWLDDPSKTVNN